MVEEQVILVNEYDEQIGLMPKMEAHGCQLPFRCSKVAPYIGLETNMLVVIF